MPAAQLQSNMTKPKGIRKNKVTTEDDVKLDNVPSGKVSCDDTWKGGSKRKAAMTSEDEVKSDPLPSAKVPCHGIGMARSKREELDLVPSRMLSRHDILMGRGNAVTNTAGNTAYRLIVWKYREKYISASRDKKRDIAMQVMKDVYSQHPPGRFLEMVAKDMYKEVSTSRALEKCCQSLREKKYVKAPSIETPSLLSNKSSSQISSSVKKNRKRVPPAKALTKKSTKAKTTSSRKAKLPMKPVAKQPDPVKTNEAKEPQVHQMTEDEEVAIYDRASFINAKKLLLGSKKLTPDIKAPPPLEKPCGFQSIERLDDSLEACEGDVFDGMFNMVPLSLVEFYSTQVGDSRNSRDKKTREESIESPTTVLDDFGFAPPVPLQMAHSLYLEGESKWVNPSDNVTANVVAAWTEFATSGGFRG